MVVFSELLGSIILLVSAVVVLGFVYMALSGEASGSAAPSPGSEPATGAKKKVPPKYQKSRVVVAVVWALSVIGFGVAMRVDADLRPCATATESTGASKATETTTDANGAVTSTKTTDTPASTKTTSDCDPIGAAELVLLLLPSIMLVVPEIKGFSLAGIGIDLRDAEQKAVQATDEAWRVIEVVRTVEVQSGLGTQTVVSQGQLARGETLPLPDPGPPPQG